jgi:hypothetical protein
MPNYLDIIGTYFPSTEAYSIGDCTNYNDIVFIGSPIISQATLDSYTSVLAAETPPDDVAPVIIVPTSIANGDILVFNETSILFEHKSLSSAGISVVGHAHTKSDISDFPESDYVHTTGVESINGDKTFTGSLDIGGDVNVAGSVIVAGSVNFVNSTTVDIGDNIIILNAAEYGPTPTQDAGIEVQRGWASIGSPIGSPINYGSPIIKNPNARLIFEESTDTWKVDPATGSLVALSLEGHTHSESDITDLAAYLIDVTGEQIDDLSNITITSLVAGEVLVSGGSPIGWINQTLSEAGIAASNHAHLINDISDVTITTVTSGEILKWNGSAWINNTLTEAGISADGHTHTESDITDLGTYLTDITGQPLSNLSDVTITSIAADEILKWNGSAWINNTLAEAGISVDGHTHSITNLSNVTISSLGTGEVLISSGSPLGWINGTLSEAGIAAASHNHDGTSPSFDALTTNTVVVNNTATFDAEYSNGTSGSSKTINWNNGNKQYVVLSAACTFTFTNPQGPCNLILRVYQNSSYTLNFPSAVKWAGGNEVECSTGAGKIDIYMFYFDGSIYYGSAIQNFS